MIVSPANSPSSSPPYGTMVEMALQGHKLPAAKRLSEVAMAKLATLTEFLPNGNPFEQPISRLLSDPALSSALKEIDKDVLLLINNKALNDKALSLILQYCPALQSLNLLGFYKITEAALFQISNLNQLTTLNLCGTQVKNLQPLIDRPLPHLLTVNLYQTPVDSDSLISFLKCHKIVSLTPPKNPPKSFFTRFPLENLSEVLLHIDNSSRIEDTVGVREILDLERIAPALKKLQVWIQLTLPDSEMCDVLIWSKKLKKNVIFITKDFTYSISPN